MNDQYRQRIAFLRTHGYVLSLLPQEGIAAYDTMCEATRRYESGRLTQVQERDIRASIVETTVDYRPRNSILSVATASAPSCYPCAIGMVTTP